MRKLKSFKDLKDGDWLLWKHKSESFLDDVAIIKIEDEILKETFCWSVFEKGETGKSQFSKFNGINHKSWNIFILNKKEIDKYKMEITLSKL